MDSLRGLDMGSNPLSSKFQTTALQNMQSQISTVKNNKDLEAEKEPNDHVQLSHRHHQHAEVAQPDAATSEQHLESASNSGELADLTDKYRDDDARTQERRANNEEAEMALKLNGKTFFGMMPKVTEEADMAIDVGISDKDRARQVHADVPDEIYEAASQFVKSQMSSETKPNQGLVQLKSIPEPGRIETAKEDFAPMLDIHDGHNQPMPVLEEALT